EGTLRRKRRDRPPRPPARARRRSASPGGRPRHVLPPSDQGPDAPAGAAPLGGGREPLERLKRCKGAGGIPTFCTFCTLLPGLHPSARSAPFCQVCTLLRNGWRLRV